jgi:hypothetical protein
MWHAWERREKCARFWWESPKEEDHSKEVDGRMGPERILGKLAGECGVDTAGSGLRALVNAVMNFGLQRHGVN